MKCPHCQGHVETPAEKWRRLNRERVLATSRAYMKGYRRRKARTDRASQAPR